MSDELPPYSAWLVSVAAAAKRRDWINATARCIGCGAFNPVGSATNHREDCPFSALDAALDKEPQP